MEKEIKYDYFYGRQESLVGIYLIYPEVTVYIYLDKKHHTLKINMRKSKKSTMKRKRIPVDSYLEDVINYLKTNNLYISRDGEIFKENILLLNNVKWFDFENLKINKKIIDLMKVNFRNLISLTTKKCTIYNDANIGCLDCHYWDCGSYIYGMEIFNCFKGKVLSLDNSIIKKELNKVIHIDSEVMEFKKVIMDYKMFFLRTDAKALRKITIELSPASPKLKHEDLLFLNGFYNLESVEINAVVRNFDIIRQLERLRRVKGLLCTNQFGEDDWSLLNKRLHIQNQHLDMLNELYVDRLYAVSCLDKIKNRTEDEVKEELLKINQMSVNSKRNIGKPEKKERSIFDSSYELDFDCKEEQPDEVLVDSRPFEGSGIQYYVKRKKISLD